MGNNSLKSLICIDKNSHLWAPMVPTCLTFGYGEVGNCFVIKNMHVAERKMDPASRTTQKHVVKSICLREPQKMVRKSFAMGYNSLKSRICINKNFLGAYGTHRLDLWVLEDWELIFQYQKHVVKSICLREPQKMV